MAREHNIAQMNEVALFDKEIAEAFEKVRREVIKGIQNSSRNDSDSELVCCCGIWFFVMVAAVVMIVVGVIST